jgi:hypothetical protein
MHPKLGLSYHEKWADLEAAKANSSIHNYGRIEDAREAKRRCHNPHKRTSYR